MVLASIADLVDVEADSGVVVWLDAPIFLTVWCPNPDWLS